MPSFLRSRQRWLTNVLFSFWLAIFFTLMHLMNSRLNPKNKTLRMKGRVLSNFLIIGCNRLILKTSGLSIAAAAIRSKRYTIICKLKNLKVEDTARAAIRVLKVYKARVHTITMDNGKEFYQHTKIAKALKAETYFCRPYHSWEKGLSPVRPESSSHPPSARATSI